MKIVVDRDLCESNGRCVDACPQVFRLDDDDRLVILIEPPGETFDAGVEQAIQQAVRICPRQALSLEE